MAGAIAELRGVLPIAPTPFDSDGRVLVADVEKLVEYYRRCGVAGLTILGNASEVGKLSRAEIETLVRAFLRCCDGLPVLVGVTSASLTESAALGRFACEFGAAGVLIQPLAGLKEDSAVIGFYRSFVRQTDGTVPICLQDYPVGSGVYMSVSAIVELAKLPEVVMLKHEPFPGLQKLTQIMEAHAVGAMPGVAVMASSNCLYLAQELARGAHGAITGVALSDVIVRICALFAVGERCAALDLFDAALPLNRHEAQGPFGHAVRKEILRRRGVLSTGVVRYPGPTLTTHDIAELELLIDRFRTRCAELSHPFVL